MGDAILPFEGTFEHTFSVPKGTSGLIKMPYLARSQCHRLQFVEHIFEFYPIGPNVLQGCRSHRAGDEREVFQATITLCNSPQHQIVPDFSPTDAHPHLSVILVDHLNASNLVVEDAALKIAQKQHIAAAAQNQKRVGQRQQSLQLGYCLKRMVSFGFNGHSKSVQGLQLNRLVLCHHWLR